MAALAGDKTDALTIQAAAECPQTGFSDQHSEDSSIMPDPELTVEQAAQEFRNSSWPPIVCALTDTNLSALSARRRRLDQAHEVEHRDFFQLVHRQLAD